jgi:hypothetical protein
MDLKIVTLETHDCVSTADKVSRLSPKLSMWLPFPKLELICLYSTAQLKFGDFPHISLLADFLHLFCIDKHAKLYTYFILPCTITDALHSLKYMVGVSYLVRRSAEDPKGLQGCGILTVHLPALLLQVGNIHSQCCGSASLSCGSRSYLSLWCGSLSRSNNSFFLKFRPNMLQNDLLIRLPPFLFDADPDPDFHFDADSTLMAKADPDPASQNDADPCWSGFARLLIHSQKIIKQYSLLKSC